MRLIHIPTLHVREFFGSDIPEYVILSHRWTQGEITFKDFEKGRKTDSVGYKKVVEFCREVQGRSRIEYGWIDTVCIDKKSSTELSEAINSMFNYYRDAEACYVYMADVGLPGESIATMDRMLREDPFSHVEDEDLLEVAQFGKASWHSRGWTLQELLAPKQLLFFSRSWRLLGYKGHSMTSHAQSSELEGCGLVTGAALTRAISKATNIPEGVLDHKIDLHQVSVAERLSWLARRKTTRIEDIAYCALGILNVHIPLQYGEGDRAFTRLQEEVLRTSNDESLFAWPMSRSGPSRRTILATSPADFLHCGPTAKLVHYMRPPYTITNQGLELRLEANTAMCLARSATNRTILIVPLNCGLTRTSWDKAYACIIALEEQPCGHFERVCGDDAECVGLVLNGQDIHFLRKDKTIYAHTPTTRYNCTRHLIADGSHAHDEVFHYEGRRAYESGASPTSRNKQSSRVVAASSLEGRSPREQLSVITRPDAGPLQKAEEAYMHTRMLSYDDLNHKDRDGEYEILRLLPNPFVAHENEPSPWRCSVRDQPLWDFVQQYWLVGNATLTFAASRSQQPPHGRKRKRPRREEEEEEEAAE